jgi:hypothetical protein
LNKRMEPGESFCHFDSCLFISSFFVDLDSVQLQDGDWAVSQTSDFFFLRLSHFDFFFGLFFYTRFVACLEVESIMTTTWTPLYKYFISPFIDVIFFQCNVVELIRIIE